MKKLIIKRIPAWSFVITTVALLLLVTTNGGGFKVNSGESEELPRTSNGPSKSEAVAPLACPADLKFSYKKRKRFGVSAVVPTTLITHQSVAAVVEELKKQIALPFDIQVVF